jgi:hypothetical protein
MPPISSAGKLPELLPTACAVGYNYTADFIG